MNEAINLIFNGMLLGFGILLDLALLEFAFRKFYKRGLFVMLDSDEDYEGSVEEVDKDIIPFLDSFNIKVTTKGNKKEGKRGEKPNG